jgi:hypothetical protein
MLRLLLPLLAAIAVLTSCDNEPEEGDSIFFGATPTPTIDGNIIFCPRIGVAGESTPSSPTPEPSCEPGDHLTAPPGVHMTINTPPALPSGFGALTEYYEIVSDSTVGGTIGVPSIYAGSDDILVLVREGTVAWYTFDEESWVRLENTVSVIQTVDGDGLYSSAFGPMPQNLILLAQ